MIIIILLIAITMIISILLIAITMIIIISELSYVVKEINNATKILIPFNNTPCDYQYNKRNIILLCKTIKK